MRLLRLADSREISFALSEETRSVRWDCDERSLTLEDVDGQRVGGDQIRQVGLLRHEAVREGHEVVDDVGGDQIRQVGLRLLFRVGDDLGLAVRGDQIRQVGLRCAPSRYCLNPGNLVLSRRPDP